MEYRRRSVKKKREKCKQLTIDACNGEKRRSQLENKGREILGRQISKGLSKGKMWLSIFKK